MFDSDTELMTDNPILLRLALKNKGVFLTPTGGVKAKKVDRKNTMEDKARLDNICKSNLIGEDINCSQVINSKIWEAISRGDNELAQELYVITSQLDVMSNLAIDSAKREFPVDLRLELKTIREKYVDGDKRPMFFKFISKDKGNVVNDSNYRWYDTPMDYLIDIVDRASRKRGSSQGELKLWGIMNDELCKDSKRNHKACVAILSKAKSSQRERDILWSGELGYDIKIDNDNSIRKSFTDYVGNFTLHYQDIRQLVRAIDEDGEFVKSRKILLNALFDTNKTKMNRLLDNR